MLFNSVAEITDGEENVSITVRHWSLTQTPSLASMAFCQLFQKIGIPMAQLVSIKPIAAKTERVHILGTSRRVYRILRRVRAARSPCIGQIDTQKRGERNSAMLEILNFNVYKKNLQKDNSVPTRRNTTRLNNFAFLLFTNDCIGNTLHICNDLLIYV